MKTFEYILLLCIFTMLIHSGCIQDIGDMEDVSSGVVNSEFGMFKVHALGSYSELDYFLTNNVTDSILSNIIV